MPNSRSNKLAKIESLPTIGDGISPAREEMQKKMEEGAKKEKSEKGGGMMGGLSNMMGMLGK